MGPFKWTGIEETALGSSVVFLDDGNVGHEAVSPAFSLCHCGGLFMQGFEPLCRMDHQCAEASAVKGSVSPLLSSLDSVTSLLVEAQCFISLSLVLYFSL